jgi:hypothetical protein
MTENCLADLRLPRHLILYTSFCSTVDEMAAHRDLVMLTFEVAAIAGRLASRLADSLLSQSRTRLTEAHVLGRLGVILGIIAYRCRSGDLVKRNISQNRFHKFLKRLEAVCTVVGSTPVCECETLISFKVATFTSRPFSRWPKETCFRT